MATDSNNSSATRDLPEIGTLVVDTGRDRIGVVMDHMDDLVQLRPPGGGREWDCRPSRIRPATRAETLSARVSAANADSRLPH
ncbi:hypothetical protein V1L54_09585 [Streptomyces sp. TRM 70361]|uniref:hypothetical protein n=1 Tax=Streptomyces sp. TRM 70361 TaxID=3116553 RepID=UPI002E7AC11C|nr:hypothetical protein [Streptomyces sp. TRM 70361]MEE1939662.1 hypothetical protein [Streptomyces sp. TRM 70361]